MLRLMLGRRSFVLPCITSAFGGGFWYDTHLIATSPVKDGVSSSTMGGRRYRIPDEFGVRSSGCVLGCEATRRNHRFGINLFELVYDL